MIFYAIRYGETLLGFSVESNEGADFCNDVSATLETISDNVWTTTNRSSAERVIANDREWYNASPCAPSWGGLDNNLMEIVEVTI